ncbi:MAG: VWA domain-containing protein [Terracidiphilus sp.]|jgi:VWFA-related protein
MSALKFVCAVFAASLTASLPASAQQLLPPTAEPSPSASSHPIQLDVVVDAKSGQPVNSLGQQDFTILDNKSPRPVTSFKIVTGSQQHVSVILFIDAVNTPYELVADLRNRTEKFLKENEGALAHPTSIAILTDDGVQLPKAFSANGLALSDDLEQRTIGLHKITRSDAWSAGDRLTICIRALHQLTQFASRLPGRKVILWISPGFPLASGPGYSSLTPKAQQAIFGDVTYFSSELRQNNITLYNINPVGTGQSTFTANYYQNFLKGVTRPDETQLADLSIQVLSIQSGGLALVSNNDVAGMIQTCLTDVNSWYEITFDAPPTDKPNEYHHIEFKLDQPGLTARTRTGYYSNTTAGGPDY